MEQEQEQEQSKRRASLVPVVREPNRTRKGWENEVDVHSWEGVPYPLGSARGRFRYTTPLALWDQARQCWVDRASLNIRDVDVEIAAKAGARKIPAGAAQGAVKAAAVGWLGGPGAGAAVAGGAAKGALGGFGKGVAKSAMDQMCRGKK